MTSVTSAPGMAELFHYSLLYIHSMVGKMLFSYIIKVYNEHSAKSEHQAGTDVEYVFPLDLLTMKNNYIPLLLGT